MAVKYLDSFTVYPTGSDEKIKFDSLHEAQAYVERIVGNRSFAKPFPNEKTYLYGPGNGDTTHMIRQDCTFI
jgi:hypothetical protein